MCTIIIPENLDERMSNAVDYFWATRNNQINTGIHDQGNRGAATGGKQLDGIALLLKDILMLNGVPEGCIFFSRSLELPGYYRATKKWDLLVVDNDELIIAIELKSHIGPSFGNNYNNRIEEALGTSLDIWTAYREGVFGTQAAPWLGYFMVLEDCPQSNREVTVTSPHFPVLQEFNSASYIKRYEIFCNKLLLERKYNASCLTTTSNTGGTIRYNFPSEHLSCREFLASMLGAVVSHFDREHR